MSEEATGRPPTKHALIAALLRAGRHDFANVVAYRVAGETAPLPDRFHKNEPGLLTLEEFLRMRNPKRKRHEPGSYETTVERMNQDHTLHWIGDIEEYGIRGNKKGYLIERNDDVVGVIHSGTLYHRKDERLPDGVIDRQNRKWRSFDVTQKKAVKYPVEYVRLVSDVARDNLKRYPNLIQNLRSGGESFQVRSEKKLVPNKGMTLALLNSSGLEVGSATDEWGATLIMVANEYQRRGFGRMLAKLWYRWNPEKESGGFTPQGERNALRVWEERVHEFLSRGWYSKLVRDGRMSNDRIKAILKGVSRQWKPQPELKGKQKPQPLYLIDFPTFMIYDRAFYEDPDERYVYGFGFYRNSDSIGDFPYRIEYDRQYAKQTTALALHAAHAEGIEQIYIGRGYGDLIEYEGLTERVGETDYIYSRRFAPFDKAARLERQLRRKLDPYRETYNSLLETAESKW